MQFFSQSRLGRSDDTNSTPSLNGGHESCAPGHSAMLTANESSITPPALRMLRHSSSRFYSPESTPIQHGTTTNIRLGTTNDT